MTLRVALVGAELEENLGLRYLAASLVRAGHRADIVAYDRANETREVAQRLAAGRYDLVGLSMMFQLRAREFVALAEHLRALGYDGVLVAGGQHATFMAREILEENPAVDAIVLGDGEGPLVQIAARLAAAPPRGIDALADVPGLVVRTDDGAVFATAARAERTDLRELPDPLRAGAPRRHMGLATAPMIAGRGCYADCSFCSIVAWEKLSGGPKFRQRPPEDVAREMAALYHERGVRVFNFHDDNFWLPTPRANRERLAALARALRAARVGDVALLLKCRPNDVDPELFAQAREMGLVRVYVGIETDAPQGLVTLRRGVAQPQNQRALDVVGALDVQACSNLLIFDPDTRLADVAHNVEFLARNARHSLNFCRVEPYGGTPLTHRLAAEGRLFGDYLGFDYDLHEPRVELLWRLCHVAFHDRNFPVDGLANAMIGVAYRFHLAKRFWPGPALEALRPVLLDLQDRFAGAQVTALRSAIDFVTKCELGDHDAAFAFASDLAVAVRDADAALSLECDGLTLALERYAAQHGAGGSDGRLGEGAAGSGWLHAPASAAALGLLLAGGSYGSPASAQLVPRHIPIGDGGVVVAAPPRPSTAGVTIATDDAAQAAVRAAGLRAQPEPPQPNGTPWVRAQGDVRVVVAFVYDRVPAPPSGGCGNAPDMPLVHAQALNMEARIEGPGAGDYAIESFVTTAGTVAPDYWIDGAAHRARFSVVAASVPSDGRQAAGVLIRSRRRGDTVAGAAPFFAYASGGVSPGPAFVPLPPPRRPLPFHGCDPVAMPEPALNTLNVERAVHIGRYEYEGTDVQWRPVSLTTWLDDSVRGAIAGPVEASVIGAGTVTVTAQPPTWHGAPRRATLAYDPRDADRRVTPGVHTIRVRWRVRAGRAVRSFEARLPVRVDDEGVVHTNVRRTPPPRPAGVGPTPAPARSRTHGARDFEALPLAQRFGATLDVAREGDDFVLRVNLPRGAEAATAEFRASDGVLSRAVSEGETRAVRWSPPATRGRSAVTCVLRASDGAIAVASFRHEQT